MVVFSCCGRVNWGMIATWVTLVTTVIFNVQFYAIYRNMQQGPLFNTLLTEYSDPGILEALDLLEDFQAQSARLTEREEDRELQYAYDFLELLATADPRGKEIDHARRKLISWYSKVRLFFEFDLLSSAYLHVIPGRSRTSFFLWIVEPLDRLSRALDQRLPNQMFDFFREQYNLGARSLELDHTRLSPALKARAESRAIVAANLRTEIDHEKNRLEAKEGDEATSTLEGTSEFVGGGGGSARYEKPPNLQEDL
ncbi:unnamed protein product [Amoebophrya sp. A25]|nr:unnamed protein product [Amoebophrya sp. A25]|eukprot:GSA25T00018439001.1